MALSSSNKVLLMIIPALSFLTAYFVKCFVQLEPLQQILLILAVLVSLSSASLINVVRNFLIVTFYLIKYKLKAPNTRDALKEHSYSGIVMPSDIDILGHMNNSRYLLKADYARTYYFAHFGKTKDYVRTGHFPLVTASTVRYRKSLEIFQPFKIKTKLVHWDDESIYLEQRYVARFKDIEDFVYCIVLLKMKIYKGGLKELIGQLPELEGEKPTQTDELKSFIAYIEASSNTLRNERKTE
ncbi:protein THEM6-like [Clavelina lepadiformis]|uniref:protein THEM6-like n=1 Tax=Clavelina lepadiformis TaxID=159417 RepID=UPI0040415B77